jgi:peptidoglycan hydrolase-like protein with peptidoglycan-binding domain
LAAGTFYALVDDRHAPSTSTAGAPPDKAAEGATPAAEAQRLKDQEELTRLRAEAAAREKANQEAAQRRQIEDETRRKIEAEAAEKQRQQEAARQEAEAKAAAARKQAEEEEAARKAEAEAAQQKAEADRKAAEAAEAALGLTPADRERVQIALAAAGFPPGVTHGVFGPLTRDMIAAWQRKTGRAPTGHLTADALRELLGDAPAAEAAEAALGLTTTDRQRIQIALAAVGFPPGVSHGVFGARTREMIAAWQRKTGRAVTGYLTADAQRELLRDAPQLQEQPSAAKRAAPPAQDQASAAKGATKCDGSFSAQMCRGAFQGFPPSCWQVALTIRNGAIEGSWTARGTTEPQTLNGSVGTGGEVQITYLGIGQQTYVNQRFTVAMTGRVADGVLTAAGRAGTNGRDFSIRVQCR